MYVILALLLLGVLIIAHEAGHFWAARACGIGVQEFAMGMGPLLLKWKSKKGTQFSLRLLPIGGYCQFYGEDEESPDPRAFNRQAVWKRAITVASGPVMNFLVALVVIVLYMSVIGLPAVVPRVAQVEENAQAAGLMQGDELLSVNGEPMTDTQLIAQAIDESGGEEIVLRVMRDGEEVDIRLKPFYDEELGRYRAGFTFAQERVRVPLLQSMPFSVSYNIESVRLIVETLKNLLFKGEGVSDVTGPVGTVYVIQEVTQVGGLDVYLELIALISVNLGVMNLLPLPALDGGRLVFLIIEAVRGKRVPPEKEGMVHFAGFVLLMALMVVIMFNDILKLV